MKSLEMKTISSTIQIPPHCSIPMKKPDARENVLGAKQRQESRLRNKIPGSLPQAYPLSIWGANFSTSHPVAWPAFQSWGFQATNHNGKRILKTKSDKQMPSGCPGIQLFAGPLPFWAGDKSNGTRGIICSYFSF